jgi:peptidyl-prolyl cis-trans isomerase SurA
VIVALVLTVTMSANAQVVAVDRVIAVVNDEVITETEYRGRIAQARERLLGARQAVPPEKELNEQVLEQIIIERAERQHAKLIGIKVNDDQIEAAIRNIAKNNKMTVSELNSQLQVERVTREEFRETVRGQIIRARLRESVARSQISVSEADIDAFLSSDQPNSSGAAATEYNVEQIFLKIPEGASESEVQERQAQAEQLLVRLEAGDDFTAVGAPVSDAPAGGKLGWRGLNDLPEIFASQIKVMKAGATSQVVRSPAGLHILKLVDVRGVGAAAKGKSVTQTRVRHILIRPSDGDGESEITRRLSEIKDRVEAGDAKFEDMAKQYSVDGSANLGGDIGWIYPGDTVPEFERTMDSLQPGQISEPIRTDFGFHIIQLVERRQEKASEDRQRLTARQAIVEKRTNEAFEEWLAELRDRTYVELRLE